MKKGLSRNQAAILRAIGDLSDRRPWPPTVREIRDEAGVSSVSVVFYNMRKLERMGYLSLTPRISRGVVITAAGRQRLGSRV